MPKVHYLRVSVTDRCNFRCKYCMPGGIKKFIPHPEILRYEEITEIVRVFTECGIDSIRFTGGEPLIRKGIESLIAQIREMKEIKDISLTTNGFFLLEKSESLRKNGLDRVNVSIDTLNPEKFGFITGTGNTKALSRALCGIEKAIEEGLTPVKVNTVLIKGFNDNDDEIESFIKLSEKYGVEVRFIELMPIGEKSFFKKNFIPYTVIKTKVERDFGKLVPIKTKGNGPAKSFSVEGTKAKLGFITPISEPYCSSCNRVRLTSDGKLRLCLLTDEEVNLKSIVRDSAYKRSHLKNVIAQALLRKRDINGIAALKNGGCSRKMFTIGG